ncbi:MAG: alkaline phosphatase family protein [Deltaproteobacteria bacterium]|nr:alkaline phosphatase family protein [Deltaproteobacteria bacterium]
MRKPLLLLGAGGALLIPASAHAYIGPGAGFAFLGSTFVFLLTIVLVLATILFWPFQLLYGKLRGKGIPSKARARRVVIVGLDGMEPKLADKFMAEGLMPNLSKLASEGSYSRLGTTLPALSPVAWSTFQTGVNPGAHNIFDFLTRDKRHCLPLLSSTTTEPPNRYLNLGKWKIPLEKPKVRIMRRSQPFWKILGSKGIFSNVLRVPISYPPEKFNGNILSAMCTPDLRGSQGTFSFYSSALSGDSGSADGTTGGERHPLTKSEKGWAGIMLGPTVKGSDVKLTFHLNPKADDVVEMSMGDQKILLKKDVFSEWIEIPFMAGKQMLSGIARFCLRSVAPNIELYVSPVNVNPEKPVLPIGHPFFFPSWIAKRQGHFGTLGLLEDTWGRNEGVLDDQRFLDQTYLVHDERERMFFDLLQRTQEGLCVCVFDASDRIQHMFWRYLDDKHPSPRESEKFSGVIRDMYQKMDGLVGRVRAELKPEDVLIVLSDHGFSSFRRGVNLNTWLLQEGYMVLKEGTKPEGEYLRNVDWSRTKAFGIGLSGIFLNRKGREYQGIVEDQDAAQLKREICSKLEALKDPADGSPSILKVYDTAKEYKGLYVKEAPDLIVGYAPGYRVSWESVTGGFEPQIFTDNTKAWSGDHHVDPTLVPGVLFSNLPIRETNPSISEIAPTVLNLFAVPKPAYMEGRVIF